MSEVNQWDKIVQLEVPYNEGRAEVKEHLRS